MIVVISLATAAGVLFTVDRVLCALLSRRG